MNDNTHYERRIIIITPYRNIGSLLLILTSSSKSSSKPCVFNLMASISNGLPITHQFFNISVDRKGSSMKSLWLVSRSTVCILGKWTHQCREVVLVSIMRMCFSITFFAFNALIVLFLLIISLFHRTKSPSVVSGFSSVGRAPDWRKTSVKSSGGPVFDPQNSHSFLLAFFFFISRPVSPRWLVARVMQLQPALANQIPLKMGPVRFYPFTPFTLFSNLVFIVIIIHWSYQIHIRLQFFNSLSE